GRIHFHFHAGGTLSLLARSYRLSVIWLLVLLVRDVDKLVLGALTDARTVGTFGFANWAAFVVSLIFLQPVGRVVYPALMAYRGRRRRQLDTFRLATVGLLALEVPAAYFLFLNSDFVLRLLGGAGRWPGAADFLVI